MTKLFNLWISIFCRINGDRRAITTAEHAYYSTTDNHNYAKYSTRLIYCTFYILTLRFEYLPFCKLSTLKTLYTKYMIIKFLLLHSGYLIFLGPVPILNQSLNKTIKPFKSKEIYFYVTPFYSAIDVFIEWYYYSFSF